MRNIKQMIYMHTIETSTELEFPVTEVRRCLHRFTDSEMKFLITEIMSAHNIYYRSNFNYR